MNGRAISAGWAARPESLSLPPGLGARRPSDQDWSSAASADAHLAKLYSRLMPAVRGRVRYSVDCSGCRATDQVVIPS